ncbi:hypothetical protein L227DRAFT_496921 [Lentinus tigrinus ALCF2SS1-6]|uniref:Uncharacterized protein n=1 Tax=Lentinus tigrinus ALCF2SS1-6 TaxID=1328759 RepID=A0A5C2SKF3_9APHY|nr:hypothetical protein L227DRAFT_496921 [Lentinus tigrinus ALCF2SS1-6]
MPPVFVDTVLRQHRLLSNMTIGHPSVAVQTTISGRVEQRTVTGHLWFLDPAGFELDCADVSWRTEMNSAVDETGAIIFVSSSLQADTKTPCLFSPGLLSILIIMRQEDSSGLPSDFQDAARATFLRRIGPRAWSATLIKSTQQRLRQRRTRCYGPRCDLHFLCSPITNAATHVSWLHRGRCPPPRGQIRCPWHRSPSPMCPLPQIATSEASRVPSCRFSHLKVRSAFAPRPHAPPPPVTSSRPTCEQRPSS